MRLYDCLDSVNICQQFGIQNAGWRAARSNSPVLENDYLIAEACRKPEIVQNGDYDDSSVRLFTQNFHCPNLVVWVEICCGLVDE